MKIKKLIKTSMAALMTLSLVACGGGSDDGGSDKATIKVLNLKPEIDEALKDYAKLYSEKNDVKVEIETCGGSNCDYAGKLDQYISADKIPDIFVLEGRAGFEDNKEILADMEGEEWVADTDYAYEMDGKAYGFPLGVEGFGLTYNKDILDKAGIDPATLTSYDAYVEAFKTLDAKKDELGITAPVAMATGSGMYWVTGNHSFNSYLSGNLEIGDTHVLDELNEGTVEADRMSDYADMIELIFNNSDKTVLSAAGDQYANQVKLFTDGKTAFIHQGNWIEGDVADMENIGISPAPYGDDNAIYISAPSYFAVSNRSKNVDAAKAFLNSIYATEEGQNFMYVEAASVSPFKSIDITPTTSLAKSVHESLVSGKGCPWNQNDMPADFGMQKLGPVHEAFAKGEITKDGFVEQITKLIVGLK
ncbi:MULTISPECIES: extracellular solute-binding protein [unclassified Breznakia]|uniref:ABC transporter substrate-binding protein n=1 Tax=unclassified Breznakia TaxID=2623764 RepID=UPI0024740259|nr:MULTISPECIES: extracellular solute-binding protein [unclassified Breznakia]MDH6367319.1 raffinose/stachyose/melibiose transport system substrate-binding protein [Breznakia sp. PH1-1]MDH6404533.1 raffinose/stachyose/melibiose transport system substrate-binding protein [Breznakia sp. PF1-11]MDH6412242.1 raffinose/stachyose/melibiose transport system substrate-binding protein [Breznakia sp. PFB1-11]MDH6414486.1 raffinose/stachyose/melibiose transport system substrate-binding protein [Breznakia 